MIRTAVFLTAFVLLGHIFLPKFRTEISVPVHQHCLEYTPVFSHRPLIQALVCGRSLTDLRTLSAWKALGLIHLLVVSGGHLVAVLGLIRIGLSPFLWMFRDRPRVESAIRWLLLTLLSIFAFANRLQPPVLRALFDVGFRPALRSRGWLPAEITLVTTWLALPFASSGFDLISLGLSFTASLALGRHSNEPAIQDDRWTRFRQSLLSQSLLQISLWWLLLPILAGVGVPHPIATVSNTVLTPLVGFILVPAALTVWLFGHHDLIARCFSELWAVIDQTVDLLAHWFPPSRRWLDSSSTTTAAVLLGALLAAVIGLLLMERSLRHDSERTSSMRQSAILLMALLVSSIAVYAALGPTDRQDSTTTSLKELRAEGKISRRLRGNDWFR